MSDSFTINQAYAERYNKWRQKEELQKLKARYGSDVDEGSSSSSESEDDNEGLSEKFDKGWLKAYAALKSNDANLLKKNVQFYEEESEDSSESSKSSDDGTAKRKKKREKPMFIKDYERKVILEKGGIVEEDESGEEDQPSTSNQTLGYYQEQEKLRKSIVEATQDSSGEDSSGDDGLLKRRVKTQEEKDKEESDYLDWLKGQKDTGTGDIDPALVPLKNYWDRPDLDEGEKFLRNFILNKEYMEKEDESMPTYDELVDDPEDLLEDEELLTLQDKFERKYNFRFEEPGAADVQTFPRDIEDSLRQKDNRRKEKRQGVKERKEMEKEQKKEEIKQLKNLKRQEILAKIEQLKQITGNPSLGFDEKDLEGDFDPQKHDQMMQQYFSDTFYAEGEDVKPEFEMSDDDEQWDNWTGEPAQGQAEEDAAEYQQEDDEPHVDDPDFIMDADYDPSMTREKKKKKNKKKNKLAEALLKDKPAFDPNEKTFEEYFDEYYKLDYEDIVGDMPTRFRYRKVPANSFGLSMDEIIAARDKELNAWVSIKKMSQYRTEEEELRDVKVFGAKGSNLKKKQNVLTSLFDSSNQEDEPEKPAKKSRKARRKEKERKVNEQLGRPSASPVKSGIDTAVAQNAEKHKIQKQHDAESANKTVSQNGIAEEDATTSSKEKKKKKKAKAEKEVQNSSQDSGLGTDSKTGKHKLEMSEEDVGNVKKIKLDCAVDSSEDNSGSKKKKKEKKKEKDVKNDLTESDKAESIESLGHVDNQTAEDKALSKKAKKALKKKRKKELKRQEQAEKPSMSEDRLKAYGINPSRYKYMSKQDMFTVKPRKEAKAKQVD